MQTLNTSRAPAAVGPYSQAVRAGDFVFLSGQIPLDPATGGLVTGPPAVQTKRVLDNLAAVLSAIGGTLDDVVKTTVYVSDLSAFAEINTAYQQAFGDHRPARATVEVARLPKDVAVEVEAVAYLPENGAGGG